MAPTVANNTTEGDNDLDSIFDLDLDNNDLFREIDTSIQAPEISTLKRKAAHLDDDGDDDALGLNTQIKVKKQRQPVAKLDDARLLSQAGVPKLRRIAKEKLRFKGKGYEYLDCERLLNFYQLWLDDLYPRAKFADGLTIIEKLGHSKRMQIMRKEWIDEGKPKLYDDFDLASIPQLESSSEQIAAGQEPPGGSLEASHGRGQAAVKSMFGNGIASLPKKTGESNDLFFTDDEEEAPEGPTANMEDSDNDLDALLAERDQQKSPTKRPELKPTTLEPDDDDLDALLAERDQHVYESRGAGPAAAAPNTDDDELDALLAERDQKSTTNSFRPRPKPSTSNPDDGDDLDALLAEQTVSVSCTDVGSKTVDSEGADDPDALLAERPTTPPAPAKVKQSNKINQDDEDALDALLLE